MENTPWNHLPCEVVEQILLNVPAKDLLFNEPWVCKIWTKVLLDPKFWTRKLLKMNIRVKDNIQAVVNEIESNMQVACLYHTCLYEEEFGSDITMEESILQNELPTGSFAHPMSISDDIKVMVKVAGFLVTRPTKSIELHLEKENIPLLPLLLKLLAIRKSRVLMYDNYGFLNFSPRYDYIKLLKGPKEVANMSHLKGCVSSMCGLIGPIKGLKLSIAKDDENIGIDPGISSTRNKLSVINIKAGTELSNMINLKKDCTNITGIIISDLESHHISWLTTMIKNIGRDPYSYRLIFLSYTLNLTTSEELLRSIAEVGIQPLEINCATSTLTKDDAQLLEELATELFTDDFDEFKLYRSNKVLLDDLWI